MILRAQFLVQIPIRLLRHPLRPSSRLRPRQAAPHDEDEEPVPERCVQATSKEIVAVLVRSTPVSLLSFRLAMLSVASPVASRLENARVARTTLAAATAMAISPEAVLEVKGLERTAKQVLSLAARPVMVATPVRLPSRPTELAILTARPAFGAAVQAALAPSEVPTAPVLAIAIAAAIPVPLGAVSIANKLVSSIKRLVKSSTRQLVAPCSVALPFISIA